MFQTKPVIRGKPRLRFVLMQIKFLCCCPRKDICHFRITGLREYLPKTVIVSEKEQIKL